MARNGVLCADVPLRNSLQLQLRLRFGGFPRYKLTYLPTHSHLEYSQDFRPQKPLAVASNFHTMSTPMGKLEACAPVRRRWWCRGWSDVVGRSLLTARMQLLQHPRASSTPSSSDSEPSSSETSCRPRPSSAAGTWPRGHGARTEAPGTPACCRRGRIYTNLRARRRTVQT